MGYHHLALAAKDMKAIHHFYEEVMQFELVKVEVGPSPQGGWAKHFFYRMEDDSKFIAFWEMHEIQRRGSLCEKQKNGRSKRDMGPIYVDHPHHRT